jgi:hypothetical protein
MVALQYLFYKNEFLGKRQEKIASALRMRFYKVNINIYFIKKYLYLLIVKCNQQLTIQPFLLLFLTVYSTKRAIRLM